MIGRQTERTLLNKKLRNKRAELIAVIGRRRVGKTFLIHQHYKKQLVFEFTGTQYADTENQLQKFAEKLDQFKKDQIAIAIPENWAAAFKQLKIYLQSIRRSKRKPVIFFDEFPWIDSPRSGFLNEFAYWWNDWASRQNIVVVICGSAASWMIDRVVNHKGGLHNRITECIHLKPFTLAEEVVTTVNTVFGVRKVANQLEVQAVETVEVDPALEPMMPEFEDGLYIPPRFHPLEKYNMNAVQFVYGAATLTEASFPVLDKLAMLLKQNEQIHIELSVHTDNQGTALGQMTVTELRAETLRQYLLAQEVNPARLMTTGYGATRPVAYNDSAEGRQQNRRVEIAVLKDR